MNGRIVSGFKENRQNEGMIREAIQGQLNGTNKLWLPHAGWISVSHVFCFSTTDFSKYKLPFKGTCDGDNLEKAVWDALNGVLWEDDSWIYMWTSKKIYHRDSGLKLVVNFYES